jgi:hypothetical protein
MSVSWRELPHALSAGTLAHVSQAVAKQIADGRLARSRKLLKQTPLVGRQAHDHALLAGGATCEF